MLESQIDDFSSHERFVHSLLGLLAWTSQVECLADIPGTAPGGSSAARINELFLGIVSVGRTLRAAIGSPSSPDNTAKGQPAEPSAKSDGSARHGMLR